MSLKRIIANWDFFSWILAIMIVSLAGAGVAEAIDWLDRRACRVDGGTVQRLEDSHDWRCVGGPVRR